ncbi:MAG: LacI family DNA-binding transcriptional regulator [Bacteroidales bacterium]|jgi:LacI family transcriptional regulator|nr:LacI family DNA-binding transcriptional regulator [Bacteroidales bacterium]
MKGHQVTIKDIAKILHISPSTVSRALKDHPDINPQTKKNVKELAEKLNYKPNKVALSLLQQESKIIGVIIPEIIHYFFSTVISGIEKVANESGYHIIIAQSNESYYKEVENVQALLSSNIDGFIISMAKTTMQFDHFKNIEEIGVPMVFFDRSCDVVNADRVIVDDFDGAYKATKHLIDNGCKNIIHLAGPLNLDIGKKRKEGYLAALNESNLPIYDYSIQICDTKEHAFQMIPELLRRQPSIDGIFAVNDLTAVGAIKAIKSIHKDVPKDVLVVGFTNSFISQISDPELTTVDQKGFEMGQNAARLLLKRIQSNENYGPVTTILNTELVERKSSRRK